MKPQNNNSNHLFYYVTIHWAWLNYYSVITVNVKYFNLATQVIKHFKNNSLLQAYSTYMSDPVFCRDLVLPKLSNCMAWRPYGKPQAN